MRRLHPPLHRKPMAAEGGLTALHLAARSGSLEMMGGGPPAREV